MKTLQLSDFCVAELASAIAAANSANPPLPAPEPPPLPVPPPPEPPVVIGGDLAYTWDWNTVPMVIDTYPQMTQRGALDVVIRFVPDRPGLGDITVVEYPGNQQNAGRTARIVRKRDGAVMVERSGAPVNVGFQVGRVGMPPDLWAPLEQGVEYAYVLRSAEASDVRITCHRPQ